MKKNILFLVLFFVSTYLFSQNIFEQPSFVVNGITYICKNIGNGSVIIKNQNNTLLDIPQDYSIENNWECYNMKGIGGEGIAFIISKIRSVFTSSRFNELKTYGQRAFLMTIWIDKIGKIKEMYFRPGINSKFTAQEIYNMEMILKNLQVPFDMGNCPNTGTGYFLFSPIIRFNND